MNESNKLLFFFPFLILIAKELHSSFWLEKIFLSHASKKYLSQSVIDQIWSWKNKGFAENGPEMKVDQGDSIQN